MTPNDLDFVSQIETCRFYAEQFDHAAHVHLAWCYLERHSTDVAADRMCDTLRRFSAHAGAPEKLHITMTDAFVRIIASRPRTASWDAFVDNNEDLFRNARALLCAYFSEAMLTSDEARRSRVPPDIKALP